MTIPNTAMTMSLLPQLRCSLAPELRQSLKLLQMSAIDLIEYLKDIEQMNPMIELEWTGENRLNKRTKDRYGNGSRANPMHLTTSKSGETLEQALYSQLRLIEAPSPIKRVAAFLAGNLNEDGYLDIALKEASEHMGVPQAVAESGLKMLQSLEPSGVAARSLEECLLLQVYRDESPPRGLIRLIQNHLTDIAKGKWKAITKSMGIQEKELHNALKYIRCLNPRPGSAYSKSDIPYVIPEAKLSIVRDYAVCSVRTECSLRLRIHSFAGEKGTGSLEWLKWVSDKRKEATQLEEMLHFRVHALQSVITAVAKEQRNFLLEGPSAIRPLKLEQIAAVTGFHLSTVSRAVRDKFVDTPYGVLPLNRFFSTALKCDREFEASARAVKHRIRSMIANEDKRFPLTDIRLSDALRKEGISISRRTIAKYREEERLLPSALRVSPAYSLQDG